LAEKAGRVFGMVDCRAVPEEAGDHYARITADRQRRGLSMGENDLWIAATALALDATLVSRDGDFQQVNGLKVVDWTT
jgi:tRNA(fMet)-specific endonuclease VapC